MFFYSILAITTVFFASAFLNPSPLNFISGIALFPIVIYFWLRVTNPREVSSGKWSVRFLAVLILLSALGIYAFSLRQGLPKPKESVTDQRITELTAEIKALREKDISNEELKAELAKIQEKLDAELTPPDESFTDLFLETTPSASPSASPKPYYNR